MKTVEKIREAFDTDPFDDPACAFGFTEAVAVILDAVQELQRPASMHEHFTQMWRAYAHLFETERSAALQAVLGDKYEQLTEHNNRGEVFREILARIDETFGGIKPGVTAEDVDVRDILERAGIA
jgi:hypothetical protein